MSEAARALVDRALGRAADARMDPASITVELVDALAGLASGVVAARAGGEVPSLAFAGRHTRLDEYVAHRCERAPSRIIDVGCGFPPLPTVETAARFPDAEVVGLDPGFPAFVVEQGGARSFFGKDARFRYSMSETELVVRAREGSSPSPSQRRAEEAFAALVGDLDPREVLARPDATVRVREGDDALRARLVANPVRTLERPGLRFFDAAIGDLPPARAAGSADVVRCMNVLAYFAPAARDEALSWMAALLLPGGLLVVGHNFAGGTQARYAVYRKHAGALEKEEVAFSLDCVRPLGPAPWFDFEPDPDLEELVACVGHARSDDVFRIAIDARFDRALAAHGVAERRADGCLHIVAPARSPYALGMAMAPVNADLDKQGAALEVAGAVARGGFRRTSRNAVGDVSVSP
jgi:hypothetical protein